jgi:hypothetical protein
LSVWKEPPAAAVSSPRAGAAVCCRWHASSGSETGPQTMVTDNGSENATSKAVRKIARSVDFRRRFTRRAQNRFLTPLFLHGTLIAEKRLQTLVSEVFRLQDLPRQVSGNEPFPHGQRTTFQVSLHSGLSNVGQAVARKVPEDQSASKNFNSGADSYSSGPS